MPGENPMNELSARPDLTALLSTQYEVDEVILKELAQLLGMRLVAYIAGFGSPDEVNAYFEGRSYRQPEISGRLRLALRLANFIYSVDNGNVAAWFQGLNPQLSDSSPAWLLREGDVEDIETLLLSAARAYAIGG